MQEMTSGIDRNFVIFDCTVSVTGIGGAVAPNDCRVISTLGNPEVPSPISSTSISPGTTTDAMLSPVDLSATICELGGIGHDDAHLPGRSMLPVWSDPATEGRDHVLFAQDWAWYDGLVNTRYASRGIFDGRFKYCRYYGIGGSSTTRGTPIEGPKLYPAACSFDDHEHELYDLQEDPGELVNLAHDPGRRGELREWFGRLLEAEATEFATMP